VTAVPPTLRVYRIPVHVLASTRMLLAESGSHGHEAAVVWLGEVETPTTARVVDVYRPHQIATSSAYGLSVEITEQGLTDLISALPDGIFVLARLHTHGDTDTCHSELDDSNFLVGHIGAISVVVPGFARAALHLPSCSVHELRRDGSWRLLTPEEVSQRFLVHG